ncbi:MAG: protein kinase [Alphaproteobacteria bacterium]|nr:protein kinase [Alphaproteobacteria bacterium]
MPTIELGPFALQRPVGKGGMGEVWRGYHTEQDVPVAVKVMTAKVFQQTENHDRFRNEVRAVARLDHPGIVWVFDYGEVSAAAATASGGRLVAGSPYLAMEYAGNGTLASLRRPLAWPELRSILLNLLDALAHAHAHGVIHRDLKPGNVLVSGTRDLRPGLKLTDFGIAHADATGPSHTDEVVGTLHYMAPEQIRGAIWAQGPHTDLYALGCLAYRLACQKVPFAGRTGVDLLAAQLHQRLPRITPDAAVPDGFQQWVDTLTVKAPELRFRRAADAAKALLALGPREELAVPARTLPPVSGMVMDAAFEAALEPETESSAPTLVPTDTRFVEAQVTVMSLAAIPGEITGTVDRDHMAAVRPGVPPDWRRPGPSRRSIQLLGAGLGLYGVRTIPMVGRERERDALWRMLASVHGRRQAQVAIIRGSAGTGKSRLADWLCERAHEVGSAVVLRARFSEADAPEEPLRRMLARHLRLSATEGFDEILEGWAAFWGTQRPDVVETLRTLVTPLGRAAVDASSRHAMLRMTVDEVGRERPVVIWLDDVQWGLDGLLFAQSVLDAQAVRPTPILLVLTVRDEALAVAEQESQHLQAIGDHPDTLTMHLRPLGRRDRARLVQELLGLEPSLGAAVEERSGGNPLFAVQLIGDWVQRGVLVPGEHGFELAAGQSLHIPEDLTAVWAERVARVLDGLPSQAQWMLERAAVLGHDVDDAEWQRICDDPSGRKTAKGLPSENPKLARIRRQLVERLFANRLAEETDRGWLFGHGLLQETLRAGARAAGRWREHNRAAARMLEHDLHDENAERLGRHLLEAFEVDRAIGPLLRGIRHRRLTVGARSALFLVRTLEIAMGTRLRPDHVQWSELLVEKAATLHLLGLASDARAVALDLVDRAERHGWVEAGRLAAFRLGRIAMDTGELTEAERWLEASREVEDPTVRAEALFGLSRIATMRLQRTRAAQLEGLAVGALASSTDLRSRVLSEMFQAEAAFDAEDLARCGEHATRALDLARELGDLSTQMRCWNFRAEAARARGDLDSAAQDLTQGIALAETIGDAKAPILKCNLALVHIARGEFEAADNELAEALFHTRQLEHPPLLAAVLTFRLHAAAGSGSWTAFDDHATQAERVQFELPMGEIDSARAAHAAGELARAAGHRQRALRAWQLALDHWVKLGKDAEAAELRGIIARL